MGFWTDETLSLFSKKQMASKDGESWLSYDNLPGEIPLFRVQESILEWSGKHP